MIMKGWRECFWSEMSRPWGAVNGHRELMFSESVSCRLPTSWLGACCTCVPPKMSAGFFLAPAYGRMVSVFGAGYNCCRKQAKEVELAHIVGDGAIEKRVLLI